MSLAEWSRSIVDRYNEEVARGEHDEQCEYHVEGFYLCHCNKRRREATGFVEPPGEELYFPPPSCPRCDNDLDHDGDSWRCYGCSLQWSNSGADAEFTDDYGDDLAERSAAWAAAHLTPKEPHA